MSASSQSTYVQSEKKDLQSENKSTSIQMPTSKTTKSKKAREAQDTPFTDVTVTESIVPVSAEVPPKMKKLFSHKKEVVKAENEIETETEAEADDNKAPQPAPKKRAKKDATATVDDQSAEVKPKTKRTKKTADASSDEQDSKPKRSKRSKPEQSEETEETDTSAVQAAASSSSDDVADDSQKKRKRSKKVRDPSAPKRPLSSFMVFSGLHRQEVSQSNPELKVTQISSKLGEMWGLLTDQQKAAYKSPVVVSVVEPRESGEPADVSSAESSPKAKANKRQKKENVDKAEKKAKRAEKKARKAEKAKNPDAPKKPLSSFMLFSNEHRQEVKTAHPELKITQIAQKLGQMWRQLSAEEQGKYKIIVIDPSVPVVAPVVDTTTTPVETF